MKKLASICIIATLSLLAFSTTANAQKFHLNVGLENSHIWRGMEVNNGAIMTTEGIVTDNSGKFAFGLWYGTNASDKNYNEFDYYVSFNAGGFSFSVWDFNNFSGVGDDYKIFNYRARETNHFIDATVAYDFGNICPALPINVSWSTILYGHDRRVDKEGKEQNVFSTYAQIGCPIKATKKLTLTPSVGAAFALNGASGTNGSNCYGNGAGIVDVRLAATYALEAWGYSFPISLTPMWNPQSNKGFMAFTIRIIGL